jgi:acyl carrier protein
MTERSFTRADVATIVSQSLDAIGYTWRSDQDDEFIHLFDDLNLDSLDGFDMVLVLEEAFEVTGTDENFSRTFTIHSIIETACDLLREQGRFADA